ncbi:MAG: fatty acid desaturase [Gammaproteobacteria bacterium]|nr:fatty acid desaturase [Gammaproteobacteria bacterium]
MWVYLRYCGTHLLILLTMIGLLLGQHASWLGIGVGVLGWIGSDALSPRAKAAPLVRHPWLLDIVLHSFVPSIAALSVVFAWYLSAHDLLGIGHALESTFDYPVLAARAAKDPMDILGAVLSFGLAVALGSILTAHELMHRTSDAAAMFSARWLLAMAFNASLEVAHVFGHHRDVGTPRDPATARRGENVYRFYVRSSLGQVAQAWNIEAERLRGQPPLRRLLLANKVTRGFARSLTVLSLYASAAGAPGMAVFLLASLFNKLLLEALNYLEHYGLVRSPETPYALRHAWDTDRAFSHVVLIHLPMHSEHHLQPLTHFESLHAQPRETPLLPCGYLAALVLTLLPPVWHKVMAPKLAEWDQRFATPGERALAHG